jgi:hypothetical protein
MKIAKLVYSQTFVNYMHYTTSNAVTYINKGGKWEMGNCVIKDKLLFTGGVPEFTGRALGKPRHIFMWTVSLLQFSYF